MRQISVIGIGAGDPDYVTVQAIKALNAVDVFFVVAKGGEKHDLVDLRREILERYIEEPSYRIVDVQDPDRDRTTPAYREAVEDWRRRRAQVWEQAIRDELDDGRRGAFLVWGDPALYDSTLAVIDQILARGELELEYEVIPGISSVQALAAKHGVPLNRVGGSVHVTTGRRLAEGFPEHSDDVVVMLDADCTFKAVAAEDIDIYWGAYVGTEDEILVAGRLSEVSEDIERVRAEARARKGWIMDTYLLRRTGGA
jgi:precorrin-6A synthase